MRKIETGPVKGNNMAVLRERFGQSDQQVVFVALLFRDPDDLLFCIRKADIIEMAGPPIAAVSLDIENAAVLSKELCAVSYVCCAFYLSFHSIFLICVSDRVFLKHFQELRDREPDRFQFFMPNFGEIIIRRKMCFYNEWFFLLRGGLV